MPIYCTTEGCKKKGVYNFYNLQETTKKYYCRIHRQDGMINILTKKCKWIGCNTIPSFNFEGLKPEYCVNHKEDGMIGTDKSHCIYELCRIRANYKYPDESKPTHCNKHKEEGMVTQTKRKSCEFENCEKRPTSNFEGLSPKFCREHKQEDMVNVIRKCEFEGCKIQKSFNYKGLPKKFCFSHKLPGMIDVKNACCEYEDCDKQPSYNYEEYNVIKFCHNHKLDGMIDIRNRKNKCLTQSCPVILRSNKTNKYKGYCLRCFIYLFPDEPVTRNYKTKERAVVEFILNEFPIEKYSWVYDKKISDGCSRKRPDLLLDLGYQVIIIEIDETQHTGYDNSCENKRLMELSQDVGHRPITFIRFNPDGYSDNGNKIKSCWELNDKGLCIIKKSKRKEWQERLSALKEQIDYWICDENKSEKTIEIIQLYFDK